MSQETARALSRFLGKGSAHEGAHHWRVQRLTALALIPLTLWFVLGLVCLPDYSFDAVHAWVAAPVSAVLLALLVVCLAWHSQLGVQVVIEDYVHGSFAKPLALVSSAFVHVLLGAAGVFAIAGIALKG